MKTHEFANHLELVARLLRRLPNEELEAASMSALLPRSTAEGFRRQARALPADFEVRLSEMSPTEIESFLSSDEQAFTSSNLVELAGRLGITTSKRQNRNALVNMITRHFEAGKMHSIIRGARSAEGEHRLQPDVESAAEPEAKQDGQAKLQLDAPREPHADTEPDGRDK